jgi:hypothetical protein
MLRGLAALAPKTVWLSEGKVALNASVDVVRKEMRASIAAVPEDVTVEYAASIGGEE